MPVPNTLVSIVLCILSFFPLSTGFILTLSKYSCSNSSTFTPNSTYQSNLNLLLSSLSSNVEVQNPNTWFFNTSSVGEPNHDALYGSFLCKGDIPRSECEECVKNASIEITHRCPMAKQAIMWLDQCMLRYSNTSYFSTLEFRPLLDGYNGQNVDNEPESFMGFVNKTLSHLVDQAARHPFEVYNHQEVMVTASTEVYTFAQCVPDISAVNCSTCLRRAANGLQPGRIGGRVMLPSCFVRFEIYPFYRISSKGKKHFQAKSLVAIAAATSSSALLFMLVIWFMLRKRRGSKPKNSAAEDPTDSKQISELHSLQFQLRTIEAATDNFSNDKKLGEGGFGPVYRGTLLGGQEIAAKRLSGSSVQGIEEFRNEVELVAKLQHRNLVRLLGFSMEKQETVLVYEYVSNGSLDRLLFDPKLSQQLDWSARYKIMLGVARGLLYLHEDSRLRIIHRDLKASNILLDEDMNPKISDFGMARIFCSNQMQASTNRIVGTYGYMSPEYMMFGEFSMKSDVFSFGVLMLEIIAGKKNSQFVARDCYEGLLGYVWNRWSSGIPLEVVDPALGKSYSPNEVVRCVHIGLLCVQDNTEDRPTMDSVVLMLNSDSMSIQLPQEPSFFYPSKKYKQSPSLLSSISDQFTSNGDQSNSKITSPLSGTEGCPPDPGPR